MQFLVTMTTQVPGDVAAEVVDDVRRREAVRAEELAGDGRLLRLWRPPLRPGEWRTLGLFAADDGARLEQALASMPLRVWRQDEVTALSPHPNDPSTPTPPTPDAEEFLTTFTQVVRDDGVDPALDDARRAEAVAARELAGQGFLVRLWRLPGAGQALGLWQADGAERLRGILDALPLRPWLQVETVPLAPHPSDPLRAARRA